MASTDPTVRIRRIGKQLLQLHALDSQLLVLRDELERNPAHIEAEAGALVDLLVVRDGSAAALAAKKRAILDGERDLAELTRKRERSEKRLINLISSTQIEATQREIVAFTERAGEVELEVLQWMEDQDDLESALEAAEEQVEGASHYLDEHRQRWAQREPELRAEIAQLEATRAEAVLEVDRDGLRRYEIGRHRTPPKGTDPAGVTTAEGKACATCHTEFPHLFLSEAMAHRALHSCDLCKRVLVFPE